MAHERGSRPSVPFETENDPCLIKDADAKASAEARNALLQFDRVLGIAAGQMQEGLHLTPLIVRGLQQSAIEGIYPCAGQYRHCEILIDKSGHTPPPFVSVGPLVQDMCDYANSHADNAIHCAAYLMWKVNWIHPFCGGNGRTSRAVSYLALCVCHGLILPGKTTVPEQIESDKAPYYAALESADESFRHGELNVSMMEQLIERLLIKQLSDQ